MDKNWIPYHPKPSDPVFRLPKGAVDAHCHVFGPAAEFPFSTERKYTPCDAGKDELWKLRDQLGFSRNVIVQAIATGDIANLEQGREAIAASVELIHCILTYLRRYGR